MRGKGVAASQPHKPRRLFLCPQRSPCPSAKRALAHLIKPQMDASCLAEFAFLKRLDHCLKGNSRQSKVPHVQLDYAGVSLVPQMPRNETLKVFASSQVICNRQACAPIAWHRHCGELAMARIWMFTERLSDRCLKRSSEPLHLSERTCPKPDASQQHLPGSNASPCIIPYT